MYVVKNNKYCDMSPLVVIYKALHSWYQYL